MTEAAAVFGAGLLSGLATLWVFGRWSDQPAIRRAVNQMLAHVMEFQLFLDEPRLILGAQRDLVAANARLLRLLVKPSLILALPFAVLLWGLDGWYGHAALRVGEPVVVTMQTQDAAVAMSAGPGIRVETEAVRVGRLHEASWRIRPVAAGRGELTVRGGGREWRKAVVAGEGAAGLRLPGSAPIAIPYPSANVLGWPWLVWFVAGSLAAPLAGAALRRWLPLLALAATCGCLQAQTPVILISIDTLRADHLSAYGYKKIPTPNIDSFAELPSHTSLFTSTYPFQNQVEENAEQVPAGAVTLAGVLRSHGYKTAAFVLSVCLERQLRSVWRGRARRFWRERSCSRRVRVCETGVIRLTTRPGDLSNIIGRHAAEAERLRTQLQAMLSRYERKGPRTDGMSQKTRETLSSLGYLAPRPKTAARGKWSGPQGLAGEVPPL